jgi:hypothetical protein
VGYYTTRLGLSPKAAFRKDGWTHAKHSPTHLIPEEGQRTIFRLRTGPNRLCCHMYRLFNLCDTERCPCNKGPETAEHLLQNCELYTDAIETNCIEYQTVWYIGGSRQHHRFNQGYCPPNLSFLAEERGRTSRQLHGFHQNFKVLHPGSYVQNVKVLHPDTVCKMYS